MHDAYEWCAILKLNGPVEALAAYDETLLVGSNKGHLIIYTIRLKSTDERYDVQLVRYHKNFSRKPIQQLDVIAPCNILISLSDNVISVHDMSSVNLPLITVMKNTQGASLFTLKIENKVSLTGEKLVTAFMCVVVKSKLQFYFLKNNQFLELREEIAVTSVPKALAWHGETVCIGYKGDYSLLQVDDGKQKELFPTGKNPNPSVVKGGDSTFSLIRDSQSVIIDVNGELLVKQAVKWSEIPTALTYDEPYLIALLNENIEVRSMNPVLHVQTIPLAKANMMCTCKNGLIYIAVNRSVYFLKSVSVATQIKTLIEQKQFQLALRLCNISQESDEEKTKSIHQIQTLYAYDLFSNKQYRESMKEFLKLETDPYDVIRLFPNLLPQHSRGEESAPEGLMPKSQSRDFEKSLVELIEYLTAVRLKLKQDGSSVITKQQDQEQLFQLIDTTLLKCYLCTNDALVAPVLRLNHCHIAETERVLKKHRKYSELIILYQTKGLHHRALELLEKQADQVDSPLKGHERTMQYLQHLGQEHIDLIIQFSGWVLDKYPEDGLKIFTEDIAEVEQLSRPRILDYLLGSHREQVIPYLEHVIHVWGDTNAMLHNVLIHQYRERVEKLCNSNLQSEQKSGQNTRTKLLTFLETSECYTPESVIVHFPFDDLYEERAILLGKLGRHEQSLSIYVSVLLNIEKALQYCDKVYCKGEERYNEVYIILLKLLIDPPENWLVGVTLKTPAKKDVDMALKILNDYPERIPIAKALQVLPDKFLVRDLEHYLVVSITDQLTNRRKAQITRGLLFAEHLQVHQQRMLCESKNVFLTEFMICSVCKKRFVNQSAFIRYPNGTVVHYSCQNREQAS